MPPWPGASGRYLVVNHVGIIPRFATMGFDMAGKKDVFALIRDKMQAPTYPVMAHHGELPQIRDIIRRLDLLLGYREAA